MPKRVTLEGVINRHKMSNPNTDYDYSESVLGKDIHAKIDICCKKHGIFKQSPHEHMKGHGCPQCAVDSNAKEKTRSVDDVVEKSIAKFGDKFSYKKTYETYTNMKTKCTFHCNECNVDFETTPLNHLKGYGACPSCWHKIHYAEQREEKERQKIERERIKELKKEEKRISEEQKKELKQLKEKQREALRVEREKQREASAYKKTKEYRLSEFKRKNCEKYGEKFDLSLVTVDNYVNSLTKIPVICHEKDDDGVEHGVFYIRPDTLLTKGRCPKCSNHTNRTSEEMEKTLRAIHNDRYIYKDLEGKRQRDKIEIFCKKHNIWFEQVLATHIGGHGCPYCNLSLLETKVGSVLNRLGIEFVSNARFDWVGQQSIDIYIPQFNLGIEVQGKQHFVPVEKFGGKVEHEKLIQRDNRKNYLCKENNVDLVYFFDKRYTKQYHYQNEYFTSLKEIKKYIKTIQKQHE